MFYSLVGPTSNLTNQCDAADSTCLLQFEKYFCDLCGAQVCYSHVFVFKSRENAVSLVLCPVCDGVKRSQ